MTSLKKLLPLPRRAGPRVPLAVPVVCHLGRRRVTLQLKDIASGGVFIRTPEALTRGTRFDAIFSVPDPIADGSVSHTISATCEVVRHVSADDADLIPGVGVAFVKIDRVEAGHVQRFVAAAAP
ncbi:MAG: PilZ domain-containing protein [Acidobacteria bacterium]|nr:PilZ domain-containing protein [Acidobacteriota bacterium]